MGRQAARQAARAFRPARDDESEESAADRD
jgi:hypothetical protein